MELTSQQLKEFDGSNPSKAIYISIKSTIYDVSAAGNFYGPGGPYAIFAGREASRALAKMSQKEEDVNGEIADLSEKEIGVLEDWEKKFQAKYPVVGRLVS